MEKLSSTLATNKLISKIKRALLLASAGLSLAATSSFATEAQADSSTYFADYYTDMRTKVLPFVTANLKHSRVRSFDGIEINYALLRTENSKGTIFVAPGRSESVVGQTELIFNLAQRGYSVAVIDHRGQGFSQRLIKTDAGHVGKFTDYVKDFKVFADKVSEAQMPKPYFFLGSSMGAAIGSHFAIVNPKFFKAIVTVAPMYEISSNSVYGMAIYGAALGLFEIGWGDRFAPSTKPFDPHSPFASSITTHSRERYNFDMWMIRKNPQTAVGGPTTNWVLEASRETRFLQANARNLATPLLIVQAGADSVVNNVAQQRVCGAAKDCTLFILSGSYHCVLSEIDQYRTVAIDRALEFFQSN